MGGKVTQSCWGNEKMCWGSDTSCWGSDSSCWGNEAILLGKWNKNRWGDAPNTKCSIPFQTHIVLCLCLTGIKWLYAGLASLALKVTLFPLKLSIPSNHLPWLHCIYNMYRIWSYPYAPIFRESYINKKFKIATYLPSVVKVDVSPKCCLSWISVASVGSGGFAQVNWPSESVTSKARHIPNAF